MVSGGHGLPSGWSVVVTCGRSVASCTVASGTHAIAASGTHWTRLGRLSLHLMLTCGGLRSHHGTSLVTSVCS